MDLSRYIFRGLPESREELIDKNRQLIFLRWIYLGILGVIAVFVPLIVKAPTLTVIQHAVIFSSGLLFNTVLYFANRFKTQSIKYYHVISLLQILIDLGVATAGVAIQGGAQSRAIIIYALPIVASGLLFMSKPLVYTTALLSSIAYSTTLVLATAPDETGSILSQIGGPFLFYPALFFIIARLVVYINEHNLKETRSETQEELLAMLTHQLRHPGSVIAAIIDTMEQIPEFKSSPKLKHYTDLLKTENTKNIHLVSNVLQVVDLSRSITDEGEVDLVDLINKIARNGAQAHQRVEDIKIHTSDKVMVRANNEKLHIIFENILDNAMRYSNKGTPIDIMVDTTGHQVKVTVVDHGVGMNSRQLKNVYEKFGRTTAPKGQPYGAGLGMYLVKKLVEVEDGEVDVDSAPGKGTRVAVILKKETT